MNQSEQDLDEIYHSAREQFDKSDCEIHVVELLGPYLKKRPKHGPAWLLYGDALRIIGRAKQAMDALLTALELAPETEKSYIYGRIGLLCQTYHSPAEAEKWYKRATENESKPVAWLWILRGSNLAALEEYEKSLNCLQKASRLKSEERDEAFLNMALVLRAKGQYSPAIEALKQALEINPSYQEAQSVLNGLIGIEQTIEKARKI
ncbi:MAG: tetratricopeptide repeat protein [Candidatus Parabeggiatoa sp.]|nr:tetratricopeptide repeat protein [Candidatus Parabeggiatoa sp.]